MLHGDLSPDDLIQSSDYDIQSSNEEENEVEKCVRLGSLQVHQTDRNLTWFWVL